jgi:hypothetical protein
MKSVRIAGLALVVSVAVCTGCASYSIKVDSERRVHGTNPMGTQIRIAEAVLVTPTNVPGGGTPDFGVYEIKSEELRDKLAGAAVDRYPAIFSENASATPVRVTVTRAGYRNDIGADACVSCLTLTLLPLRSWDETTYSVEVTFPGKEVTGLNPVRFKRDEMNWMSLFPTGWIPVPASGGVRALGTDNALEKTGDLMAEACADAVATILARAAKVPVQ